MNTFLKARIKLAKLLNIQFAKVMTDKGELSYDSEGELIVGTEVFITDAEGVVTIPEDGDYLYEDKIITIVSGVVTELKEKENEIDVSEPAVENFETEVQTSEEEIVEEMQISIQEFTRLQSDFKDLVKVVDRLVRELRDQDLILQKVSEDFQKAITTSVAKAATIEVEEIKNKSADNFYAARK